MMDPRDETEQFMVSFVCDHCTHRNHEECKGGTWCDCQHKTKG